MDSKSMKYLSNYNCIETVPGSSLSTYVTVSIKMNMCKLQTICVKLGDPPYPLGKKYVGPISDQIMIHKYLVGPTVEVFHYCNEDEWFVHVSKRTTPQTAGSWSTCSLIVLNSKPWFTPNYPIGITFLLHFFISHSEVSTHLKFDWATHNFILDTVGK